MPVTLATLAAAELARITPEARAVAIIRRSTSVTDKNGAVHSVTITAEILQLCEDVLSNAKQGSWETLPSEALCVTASFSSFCAGLVSAVRI